MPLNTPYVPNNGLNPFKSILPPVLSPSPLLAGHGSPEGVMPGVPGQQYCDMDTQDAWTKIAGVQKLGWEKTGKLIGYMQVVAAGS